MWPATSPGPFFGVAAFAVVAGADVALSASAGVFAESATAAGVVVVVVVVAVGAAAAAVVVVVVGVVRACATEMGADEMVNDGWVAF
jgi:hypothetical protein